MRTKTAALLTQQKPLSHHKLDEQKREAPSQPIQAPLGRIHLNRLVSQTSEYNYISICNSDKSYPQSKQCHQALELQNLRLLETNCAILQKIEGIKQYVKTSVQQAVAFMLQQEYQESLDILKEVIENLNQEWLPEKHKWIANRICPKAKVFADNSPIKFNPESAKQLASCKLMHHSNVTSARILPIDSRPTSQIQEPNIRSNYINESRVIARRPIGKQRTPRFSNFFSQKSMSSSFCKPDQDKERDLYFFLLAQAGAIETVLLQE